ncbi:MAG: flagellin, partial [Firmicutes bacterium]|nr:flagellin [Bacillota bacterium]
MIINTNVPALFAENALQQTATTMQTLQEELSTGYQINSPADNPAGLAIATLMQGELGGLNEATNNANQATNLLTTANGGIQNDVQIVQQIQQLAVQASSTTNSTQDLNDIQAQINQLISQLNSNAKSINYNGLTLMDGAYSGAASVVSNIGGTNAIQAVYLGADSADLSVSSATITIQVATSATVDTATVSLQAVENGVTVAATVSLTFASSASMITAQLVNGTPGDSNAGSFSVEFNPASVAAAGSSGVSGEFTVNVGSPLQFQV